MTLYKVLDAQGRSCNGGHAQWSLPTCNQDGIWTPGDWMPPIEGRLVACTNGYHLVRDEQLLQWLGPRLFEADFRGEMVEYNTVVCRETRLLREVTEWNTRTARLFAVWCVRETLKIIDPRNDFAHFICNVVENFVNGQTATRDMSEVWNAIVPAIPHIDISEWCSRNDIIGYSQAKANEHLMRSLSFMTHWDRSDEETWLTSHEIGSPGNITIISEFVASNTACAEGWLAARRGAEANQDANVRRAAWYAAYSEARQRQYAHLLEMLT